MTSPVVQARALLDVAAAKIRRARMHANGYRAIATALGDNVARWAYADRGEVIDGHRLESEAELELAKWQPSPADWLIVLSGPTGRGKTITAARYVADRGGMLIRATDADGWGFGGGEKLRAAEQAEILLVDDVGDEKTKPGSDNLSTLLANRGAAGRDTVATTTLLPDEILARGDHFASRLRPHFRPVGLNEPDRRSTIAPFQRGIARAFEIVGLEPRVRMVADGLVAAEDATSVLAQAAALFGVDMASAKFMAAAAAEQARLERVDALAREAAGLLAKLCEATGVRLGDGERMAEDDAALTWLDEVELEFPDPTESEDA